MIQIFNPFFFFFLHIFFFFQPFIDLTRPDEEKEKNKLNSDLIKASPIKKQKNLTEKNNQNEVLETNFVPPFGEPKSQRKLIFSVQEKCNILQGKMLTDESINLAQKPLAKQFLGFFFFFFFFFYLVLANLHTTTYKK